MVMDETLDASIMKVLVRKAAEIRSEYGFSPPYFGEDTDIMGLLQQHDISIGPQQLTLFEEGGSSGQASGPVEDPFSEDTLDRIKGDSFYGQTDIHLPDIEERLEETKRTIGSPEQIEQFVRSGLSRFGCRIEENGDGSLHIAITDQKLRTRSVGRVIERATFDPEFGLDDPDVTVLDLGHPLVRRLVEVVKQDKFRTSEEHYGRTSYLVTDAGAEVTVVFHLLARYATAGGDGAPSSVLEELVPVGVPVYGDGTLSREAVGRLLEADGTPQTRTDDEVRETLADLSDFRSDIDEVLEEAVRQRRARLVEERKQMKSELGRGDEARAWTEGLADITEGSFDVLAMTVYYPA
jgi:hypothetical protein